MKKLKKAVKKTQPGTRDSTIPAAPSPVRTTTSGDAYDEDSAELADVLCTAVWGAAAVWRSGVPDILPGSEDAAEI